MKKLSDFYILSDMDGTLLNREGIIPERNLEAIRRFTGAGGRFGVATGRSKELMLAAVGDLPINATCVLYNGGVLYDFATGKFLMETYLPDHAGDIIHSITAAMPDLGVLVISNSKYFCITDELQFASVARQHSDIYENQVPMEEITDPWFKVLYQLPENTYDQFMEFVGARQFQGVRFVGTNFHLIEMLPEVASKGYALQKLLDMGYVARENLVAIGDFYNDLEMIQLAGTGVTLNTAPEDLQAQADLIVGPCDGGAVADLIEHLEQLCK